MVFADDTVAMSVFEHPVALKPWRPPTAVYPDRHQVEQSRNEDFPPTASGREQVFKINLEGAFFSPGALVEMIVPLARAVRGGLYGPTSLLVVTSDEGTVVFLEALAAKHELSFFISNSTNQRLSEARPVGMLTPTEIETIALVRQSGGEITSSGMAKLAGIEPNAAVNRVTGLVRKGYLHRVARSRSEGDAFVDLLAAAEKTCDVSYPAAVLTSHRDFTLPDEVREGVLLIAEMQGAQPVDVLVRAWHDFLSRHHDLLDLESKEVGRMIREGDKAGLAKYASRFARERAKQAVRRTKSNI
jgi:DNA-binding MarR family transcriptional regulator